MPDPTLRSRSGLEHLAAAGARGATTPQPGVTLMPRTDVALVAVMARKGRAVELARAVRTIFALELPLTPRRSAAGAASFIWAGPGQWLAAAEAASGYDFETRLRRELAGLASVTDQSDGRTIIRMAGMNARDALAKVVPIDLHPRVFGPGDTALTGAASIGVHLWQLDDSPTYELAVFRSLAAALWHWLVASASEFGVMIRDSGAP